MSPILGTREDALQALGASEENARLAYEARPGCAFSKVTPLDLRVGSILTPMLWNYRGTLLNSIEFGSVSLQFPSGRDECESGTVDPRSCAGGACAPGC